MNMKTKKIKKFLIKKPQSPFFTCLHIHKILHKCYRVSLLNINSTFLLGYLIKCGKRTFTKLLVAR